MVQNSNLHVLTFETLSFAHFDRGAESSSPQNGKSALFPIHIQRGTTHALLVYYQNAPKCPKIAKNGSFKVIVKNWYLGF